MKQVIERREELLEKIIDALLSTGVSDLSLRPLAKSVGSSARLLIYHFGSKEQLLAVALEGVRQRIEASVRELSAKEHPNSLPDFLRMFWRWAAKDSNQRYFRLLFEINGLAMHNRHKFPDDFWGGSDLIAWVQLFESEFDQLSKKSDGPPGGSTFVLATLNGLLRDLIATADIRRTTDAMNVLIDSLSTRAPQPKNKRKRRT
jgi:AcrR family transcriptional regulator